MDVELDLSLGTITSSAIFNPGGQGDLFPPGKAEI
jgi:hypothetical protein